MLAPEQADVLALAPEQAAALAVATLEQTPALASEQAAAGQVRTAVQAIEVNANTLSLDQEFEAGPLTHKAMEGRV